MLNAYRYIIELKLSNKPMFYTDISLPIFYSKFKFLILNSNIFIYFIGASTLQRI